MRARTVWSVIGQVCARCPASTSRDWKKGGKGPSGGNLLTLGSTPQRALPLALRLSRLLSALRHNLIEFETQSMLQGNCIVNQCLSEPRGWSGPSSRCAARDVQWCNLFSERLHCSDHPLETELGEDSGHLF